MSSLVSTRVAWKLTIAMSPIWSGRPVATYTGKHLMHPSRTLDSCLASGVLIMFTS